MNIRFRYRGAHVSASRNLAHALAVLGLMLLGIRVGAAQTPWATLVAPPTGAVPAGDILRAGHLGREIAETEPIIHFYSDLIGLGLVGARAAPRPFSARHGLQEFAELGEDANAYESTSRVALLPIPGTAVAPGGTEMTIEAIEIKGITSHHFNPGLSDPGATYLRLLVRDLDKTLSLLKDERFPVITEGGNPVELSGWPA